MDLKVFGINIFCAFFNTIHDLLSHVFDGSWTTDCVLILLLSYACVLFWHWTQADNYTEADGLTGSHRLTEIYGHFLFFPWIFSISGRVQRWISIKCWDQSKVMPYLLLYMLAPLQYSASVQSCAIKNIFRDQHFHLQTNIDICIPPKCPTAKPYSQLQQF